MQEPMTNDQYLYGLRQLLEVVKTEELSGYDDTTIGDKSTECNWGFCGDDKAVWPIGKPERQEHQLCPLDQDLDRRRGCFYRCRFFNAQHRRLSRANAIRLYKRMINKASS